MQWVETRLNTAGKPTDFSLIVERSGNDITVSSPERQFSFTFATKETSIGSTELVLSLPSSKSLIFESKFRRIIELELDLLKAFLEKNVDCIPDHFFSQIHRHHLEMYGLKTDIYFDADLFRQCGFQGEVIVEAKLFDLISTDFAMTVRTCTIPSVILRPGNIQDIKIGIRLAKELGVSLVVRGSQVSHSAGGQAQSKGILLDISTFNSVELCRCGRSIKVGAGAMWNDVIQHTLDRGLMPPVVNNYQSLSVGSLLRRYYLRGGCGIFVPIQGIQAGHVEEVDVVNGKGVLVRASPNVNKDLFDLVRGGLGQFGVITSLTIPLIKARRRILTLKALYSPEEWYRLFYG